MLFSQIYLLGIIPIHRAGPDISGAQGEITTRGPYYKDQNNNLISF